MSFKILLVGDCCKDVFVSGDVHRLSPEAPVPVFVPASQDSNPGMGGNVLENLWSLSDADVVCVFPDAQSEKVRYVDRKTGHHFIRVDHDRKPERLDAKRFSDLLASAKWDAVVISDYATGFLDELNLSFISTLCDVAAVPVFVDTKAPLGPWSENAIVKINSAEFAANLAANKPWEACGVLIVTDGADGMRLYAADGSVAYHAQGIKAEVADGAGCGDTVLAALVIRYLETKGNIREAMDFANKAGAVAISKRGVVAVRRDEIK